MQHEKRLENIQWISGHIYRTESNCVQEIYILQDWFSVTMVLRLLLLHLFVIGLSCQTEFDNDEEPYHFILEAESHLMTGHISNNAEKGSRVKAELPKTEGHGHHAAGEGQPEEIFLKVIVASRVKHTTPLRHMSQSHDIPVVTRPQTSALVLEDVTKNSSSAAKLTSLPVAMETQTPSKPQVTMESTKFTPIISSNSKQRADESVTVVTRQNRNFHLMSDDPQTNSDITHDMPTDDFRNTHPHTIHITHLALDQVHPATNKRSVDSDLDFNADLFVNRKSESVNRRRREQRQKRNFAVPPEHFQPPHLRAQPATRPPVHAEFVIEMMEAGQVSTVFMVDPKDLYIRVNDTAALEEAAKEHDFIQFYVYMADADGVALSNPVLFIVYIDKPVTSSSYPVAPAVFAGVLVLCVMFLAVLIPLVTRAKRRYKQGKPLFKLGSHPSRADLEKAQFDNEVFENNREHMMKRNSSINWYGEGSEIYYNYKDEVAKEQYNFSKGLRQISTGHRQTPSKSDEDRPKSSVSEPPTLQLHKKTSKKEEVLSAKSSSSGIDTSSGAEGKDGEDTYDQRM